VLDVLMKSITEKSPIGVIKASEIIENTWFPVTYIEYNYVGYCEGIGQKFEPEVVVQVCPDKIDQGIDVLVQKLAATIATGGAGVLIATPAAPVAILLAFEEGVFIASADEMYKVASDPPDFAYTQVAEVEIPFLAELEDIESPDARRAAEDSLLLAALIRAFRISMERYQGAVIEGAFEWQAIQLAAARHFLSAAQDVCDRLEAYWSNMAPTLPSPTPAQIEAAREYLSTHGLPEAEVSCLRAFGYDQATIDNIASAAANMGDEYFTNLHSFPSCFWAMSTLLGSIADQLPQVPSNIASYDIEFNPNKLNTRSSGKWVTLYIEAPEGHDASEIDVSSLRIQNSISAETNPTEIGDNDNDGVPDLMVKFDRQKLIELLGSGEQIVSLTGQLSDGTPLSAIFTIQLIH
jgi:hypothetical protein